MHLNAHVDVDLVAVEQPDELTVLLELRAPEAPRAQARPAAAVQVVLDRSGSMGGERWRRRSGRSSRSSTGSIRATASVSSRSTTRPRRRPGRARSPTRPALKRAIAALGPAA